MEHDAEMKRWALSIQPKRGRVLDFDAEDRKRWQERAASGITRWPG